MYLLMFLRVPLVQVKIEARMLTKVIGKVETHVVVAAWRSQAHNHQLSHNQAQSMLHQCSNRRLTIFEVDDLRALFRNHIQNVARQQIIVAEGHLCNQVEGRRHCSNHCIAGA